MGWVAASRDWGRAADAGWVRALAARHGRRGRIEARCGVVAGSPTSCRGHVRHAKAPDRWRRQRRGPAGAAPGAAGRPCDIQGISRARTRREQRGYGGSIRDAASRPTTLSARRAARGPQRSAGSPRVDTRGRRCARRPADTRPAGRVRAAQSRHLKMRHLPETLKFVACVFGYWFTCVILASPLGAGAARQAGSISPGLHSSRPMCLPCLRRPSAPSFPAASVNTSRSRTWVS